MFRIAVPRFPGASSASDVLHAYNTVIGGVEAFEVAPEAERIPQADAIIIPGGYSFGDYLRPGGLARSCRVCGPIRKFARDGGPILGIGNGFQILCDLGILPGALLPNYSTAFMNEWVHLKVASTLSPFTKTLEEDSLLRLPVACYAGSYFADPRTLRELEADDHVAFRYCNQFGDVDELGFNGSLNGIAGVISRHGNVIGMMAHPERAVEVFRGGTDGELILRSLLEPAANPEPTDGEGAETAA